MKWFFSTPRCTRPDWAAAHACCAALRSCVQEQRDQSQGFRPSGLHKQDKKLRTWSALCFPHYDIYYFFSLPLFFASVFPQAYCPAFWRGFISPDAQNCACAASCKCCRHHFLKQRFGDRGLRPNAELRFSANPEFPRYPRLVMCVLGHTLTLVFSTTWRMTRALHTRRDKTLVAALAALAACRVEQTYWGTGPTGLSSGQGYFFRTIFFAATAALGIVVLNLWVERMER